MRSTEPPTLTEHGELVCPYDATLLDLYSDGTYHCWKCGSEWDVDHVRESPVWRTRAQMLDPQPVLVIVDDVRSPVSSDQGD